MRKIIGFLIKNIHINNFSILLSITQIIDKNYYHNSKQFFLTLLLNIINEENRMVEYFELRDK